MKKIELPNEANVEHPVELLLRQRMAAAKFGVDNAEYTPPGAICGHYPNMYLWDSCFSVQVFAEHGYIKEAKQEFSCIMAAMRADGMIPNIVPAPDSGRLSPERFTYKNPQGSSDYSQPPLMADSALAIYAADAAKGEKLSGQLFLKRHFGSLKKAYDYYQRERLDEDGLVAVIHSNETGRDSDPTFDFIKYRLPRRGPETKKPYDLINCALDYAGMAILSIKNRLSNWEINTIKEYFWFKDVMFNCLYEKNLRAMSKLAEVIGEDEDSLEYTHRADRVSAAIIEKMWDSTADQQNGGFFGLHDAKSLPNGPYKIDVQSISNLGPLLLKNVPSEQLKSLVRLIDSKFTTAYMLPTVATDSKEYDPNYQQKNIMWRGPVWMWPNRLYADALLIQAERNDLSGVPYGDEIQERCMHLAKRIVADSALLVNRGYYEFFSPISGEGYRTFPFSGSAAARTELRTYPRPLTLQKL